MKYMSFNEYVDLLYYDDNIFIGWDSIPTFTSGTNNIAIGINNGVVPCHSDKVDKRNR